MTFKRQTMLDYGVAWFGFDGNSSRIIDKLGKCSIPIDFMNGKPIYVNGWNDKGFAIKNTNENVGVLYNPFFTQDGTYRFKFRISKAEFGSGGVIMSNMSQSTREHYKIEMNPNGTLQLYIKTTAGGSAAMRMYTTEPLNDGKWHDVVITYRFTGSRIFVEMIVDEKHRVSNHVGMSVNPMMNSIIHLMGERGAPFRNISIDDLQLLSKYLPTEESDSFLDKRYFSIDIGDRDKFGHSNNLGIRYGTGNGDLGLNRVDMPTNLNTHGLGIFREIDKAVDSESMDLQRKHDVMTTTSNNFNTNIISGRRIIKMPAFAGTVVSARPDHRDPTLSNLVRIALMYKEQIYRFDSSSESWTPTGTTAIDMSHFTYITMLDLVGLNLFKQFEDLPDFDPFYMCYFIMSEAQESDDLFYQITTTNMQEKSKMSFDDACGYQNFQLNLYTEEANNEFSLAVQTDEVTPQELIQKDAITLPAIGNRFKVTSAVGNAKYGVSFDNKTTWKTFKNGTFQTIQNLSEGAILNTMETIDELDWKNAIGSSTSVTFGYYLEEDTFVSELIIFGATDEYEGVADTSKYDILYNESLKTATVRFKNDGRYRINYQDSIVPSSSDDE